MDKNKLAEILKFTSPHIVYVVTWDNVLRKFPCPFPVKAKNDVGMLKEGYIYWVQSIKVTHDLKSIFIIGNCAYHFKKF